MVKLDEFDIQFDNAEHVYFAGQEISGRIIIKNVEEKKINEILLEIKGCAKTYWTKHSGKSRRHCSASDAYFCEQFNTAYTHQFDAILTPADVLTSNIDEKRNNRRSSRNGSVPSVERKSTLTKKERILPAGTHEIPFSYTLPKSLPSSFEGDYGYVRYTCRAICERPWDFDISTRRAFSVVGIEDLNEDTEAVRPTSTSSSVHRRLWCFNLLNSGEISVDLQLPRTGYTPGEAICANIVVHNRSRRTIKATSLCLRQNIYYKAKTFSGSEHSRQTSKVVAKKYAKEIRPNSEEIWNDVRIVVPSVAPRLSSCKIININYALQVEIQPDTVISVPILVGTIPLLSEIVKRSTTNTVPDSPEEHQTVETLVAPDDNSVVQVVITDASGNTAQVKDDVLAPPPQTPAVTENGDVLTTAIFMHDKREDVELINGSTTKKRVRMPSSILSELYPTLPNPYYKESYFGRVSIADEKEQTQYGENLFAPKYPFYADD